MKAAGIARCMSSGRVLDLRPRVAYQREHRQPAIGTIHRVFIVETHLSCRNGDLTPTMLPPSLVMSPAACPQLHTTPVILEQSECQDCPGPQVRGMQLGPENKGDLG